MCMGCDLYFLEEDINEENGNLAQNILSEIIDVLDDDKAFKEQRIEKLVEKYKNSRQSV